MFPSLNAVVKRLREAPASLLASATNKKMMDFGKADLAGDPVEGCVKFYLHKYAATNPTANAEGVADKDAKVIVKNLAKKVKKQKKLIKKEGKDEEKRMKMASKAAEKELKKKKKSEKIGKGKSAGPLTAPLDEFGGGYGAGASKACGMGSNSGLFGS